MNNNFHLYHPEHGSVSLSVKRILKIDESGLSDIQFLRSLTENEIGFLQAACGAEIYGFDKAAKVNHAAFFSAVYKFWP